MTRPDRGTRSHSAGRGPGHRQHREPRTTPWLLMAPALLLMIGVIGYPLVQTVWMSFHTGDALQIGDWVGLANYADIFSDPHVGAAFIRTVILTAVTVVGSMVASLLIALVLSSGQPGMKILTILVILPWAMPRVSAGVLWKWAFDSQYGPVNWLLDSIGLHMFKDFSWFASGPTALTVVAVAIIWAKIPFLAIALLAGLKSVSTDLVEAGRLDGANPFQILVHIKLPVMKPVIVVLFVLATIQAFQAFDHIFVMTVPPGGPNRSTEILSLLTYLEAFAFVDGGMASGLALLTFAVLVVITIFYIRLQRDEVS